MTLARVAHAYVREVPPRLDRSGGSCSGAQDQLLVRGSSVHRRRELAPLVPGVRAHTIDVIQENRCFD
jgi:hypothetical protein